jgi:hypothetical protein
MANKYLDYNGLIYLWSRIKAILPSKTSDLTNDSGYITSADVPEGSTASTTTPLMDGTAAVGTSTAFARGDHRHPTDTSRQPTITATGLLKGGGSGSVAAASASDVLSLIGSGGVINPTYLPSYVDDVVEGYYNNGAFYTTRSGSAGSYTYSGAITGETGKIYVDLDGGATYRYGGSAYVQLGDGLTSGLTNTEIDTAIAAA